MRRKIGIFCIVLGVLCLLAALGFVLYNQWEARQAEAVAQSLLQTVQLAVNENSTQEENGQAPAEDPRLPADADTPREMATVQVDGFDCIGVLSVPVLELELPVLTDWSYEKLKKAPCLYYGSYYESDFVIAAHNYKGHFARLSQLLPGDTVIFTDVHGVAHSYEVVLLETLPATATEEMITSGFDLSLYTCTTGGGNRITVRCRAK